MNFAGNADVQISNAHISEHPPFGSRARVLLIESDLEIADEVANDLCGLLMRSHMNAGQDGFRDKGSKQQSDL